MFNVRANPASREVCRRKRAVPRPSKQRDSVDTHNSQNFGGCHALVQECNSFAIRRRSFDRGLATPWRRVQQTERELLWSFDARRILRSDWRQLGGHTARSEVSIESRTGAYSAPDRARRAMGGNHVTGALRMLQAVGRRIGVAVSARTLAPSGGWLSALRRPRGAARYAAD
jgi:hypothetical protein